MRLRNRTLLLALAAALLLTVVLVYHHLKAPPETTRLLPEADAIVFLNLAPIRTATHFNPAPVQRSPSYQHFVDATGIVAERDLNTAAFALNRRPDPAGPNGPVGFSWIVTGRFHPERLSRYLSALSTGSETYAGTQILSIPSESRVLRIALLDDHTVAGSNMPTAEQIHHMLDAARSRSLFHTPAGPSLLTDRFPAVPALALAWGIGQLGLPFADASGHLQALGLALPLPADAPLIASLRFSTALHLRVEEIAPSEPAADRTADQLTQLLSLLRALQIAQHPQANTDSTRSLQDLLDSAQIEQQSNHVALTATLPASLLHQLTQ